MASTSANAIAKKRKIDELTSVKSGEHDVGVKDILDLFTFDTIKETQVCANVIQSRLMALRMDRHRKQLDKDFRTMYCRYKPKLDTFRRLLEKMESKSLVQEMDGREDWYTRVVFHVRGLRSPRLEVHLFHCRDALHLKLIHKKKEYIIDGRDPSGTPKVAGVEMLKDLLADLKLEMRDVPALLTVFVRLINIKYTAQHLCKLLDPVLPKNDWFYPDGAPEDAKASDSGDEEPEFEEKDDETDLLLHANPVSSDDDVEEAVPPIPASEDEARPIKNPRIRKKAAPSKVASSKKIDKPSKASKPAPAAIIHSTHGGKSLPEHAPDSDASDDTASDDDIIEEDECGDSSDGEAAIAGPNAAEVHEAADAILKLSNNEA